MGSYPAEIVTEPRRCGGSEFGFAYFGLFTTLPPCRRKRDRCGLVTVHPQLDASAHCVGFLRGAGGGLMQISRPKTSMSTDFTRSIHFASRDLNQSMTWRSACETLAPFCGAAGPFRHGLALHLHLGLDAHVHVLVRQHPDALFGGRQRALPHCPFRSGPRETDRS